MPWIVQNLPDEAILETEPVEEICLGEDRVLHVLELRILEEERFDEFLLHGPDDEQIHFALGPRERPREDNELDVRQVLEARDDGALGLHFLAEETAQIRVERKFAIDTVVLLAIAVPCADEPDAPEVFEFTADAVDLFAEQPREFSDEVLTLGMEQERREQLHSRLRREQCFERDG